MDQLLLKLAEELPYVVVLLVIFLILRQDILVLVSWFQKLVEKLIAKLDGEDPPP